MKKNVKKTAAVKKSKPKAKLAAKPKTHAKKAKPAKAVKAKVASKAKAKPAAKPSATKPAAKRLASKPVATKPAHGKAPARPVAIKPSAHAAAKAATAVPAQRPAPVQAKPQPVPVAPVVAAKPAAPVAPPAPKKLSFKVGEQIVYPAHGVGRISAIEEQEIAGVKLELYIVDFEREKLRLKVPTNRAEQKGMRRLADRGLIEHAMKVVRGRARIKRTMWSRRAQEYDAKINSGDLIAVAEVVRDLYRSDRQPEQSYSERQLFEQALLRMARELAAVRKIDDDQSVKELSDYLARNAKRASAANEKAEEDSSTEEAA
jgi:CarD family transcriptional regulator